MQKPCLKPPRNMTRRQSEAKAAEWEKAGGEGCEVARVRDNAPKPDMPKVDPIKEGRSQWSPVLEAQTEEQMRANRFAQFEEQNPALKGRFTVEISPASAKRYFRAAVATKSARALHGQGLRGRRQRRIPSATPPPRWWKARRWNESLRWRPLAAPARRATISPMTR